MSYILGAFQRIERDGDSEAVPVFRQSSVQKSINLAARMTEGARLVRTKVYSNQTLYEFFADECKQNELARRLLVESNAAKEPIDRNAALNLETVAACRRARERGALESAGVTR